MKNNAKHMFTALLNRQTHEKTSVRKVALWMFMIATMVMTTAIESFAQETFYTQSGGRGLQNAKLNARVAKVDGSIEAILADLQDIENHARVELPVCSLQGNFLQWDGAQWGCGKEVDPTVQAFAKQPLPSCSGNQVMQTTDNGFKCVDASQFLTQGAEVDPTVQAYAKIPLPACSLGEVLKSDGSRLFCVADDEGLSNEGDPTVTAFAKEALPTCPTGEVLTANGISLVCTPFVSVTVSSTFFSDISFTTVGGQNPATAILPRCANPNSLIEWTGLAWACTQDLVIETLSVSGDASVTGDFYAGNGTFGGDIIATGDVTGDEGFFNNISSTNIDVDTINGIPFPPSATNVLPTCVTDELVVFDGTSWVCTTSVSLTTLSATAAQIDDVSFTTIGGLNPATALLPSCAVNELISWNGTAWACTGDLVVASINSPSMTTVNIDLTSINGVPWTSITGLTLPVCADQELIEYDASAGAWVCTDEPTLNGLVVSGDISYTGMLTGGGAVFNDDVAIIADLTADNAAFDGSVQVSNNLTVDGDTVLDDVSFSTVGGVAPVTAILPNCATDEIVSWNSSAWECASALSTLPACADNQLIEYDLASAAWVCTSNITVDNMTVTGDASITGDLFADNGTFAGDVSAAGDLYAENSYFQDISATNISVTSIETSNLSMAGQFGLPVFANATARDAAIVTPEEGDVVYMADTDQIFTYDGTSWMTAGASALDAVGGAGAIQFDNGTGTQVSDLTFSFDAATNTLNTPNISTTTIIANGDISTSGDVYGDNGIFNTVSATNVNLATINGQDPATALLPTCTVNQLIMWDGSAWVCTSDITVDNITASGDVSAAGDVYATNGYFQDISTTNISLTTINGQTNFGGDHLGQHIASQTLDMAGFSIVNVYSVSFTQVSGAAAPSGTISGSTDNQQLDLAGNVLTITGPNGAGVVDTVDLSTLSTTDTDDQTLSLSGNTLSIADGNSVDLTSAIATGAAAANTDTQDLSIAGSVISLVDGGSVDIATAIAAGSADDQTLSFTGNSLTIADGNAVDIFPTCTVNQLIMWDGSAWVCTSDITVDNITASGDVSAAGDVYATNGYFQDISTTNISLTTINGQANFGGDHLGQHIASQTLDMAGFSIVNVYSVSFTQVSGAAAPSGTISGSTDNQQLDLAGNVLTITGPNGAGVVDTVDLSTLSTTDTDDQTLSLSGNTLSIADGNSVDLTSAIATGAAAANTDTQDLSIAGSVISLVDGGSVDIATAIAAGSTDDQTLSFTGNSLTIADGNAVDIFPTCTVNQLIMWSGTAWVCTSDITVDNITASGDVSAAGDVYATNGYFQDISTTNINLTTINGQTNFGGDHLGQHIASQTLDMAGFSIVNVYSVSFTQVSGAAAPSGTISGSTDNQQLDLAGNVLTITGPNGAGVVDTVDLTSAIATGAAAANTDTQDLSIAGSVISLVDGGSVDIATAIAAGSADDQNLTYNAAAQTLAIEDGNTVTLQSNDWYGVGTTAEPGSINDNIFTQGNVGIGTNNPTDSLEVSGDEFSQLTVRGTDPLQGAGIHLLNSQNDAGALLRYHGPSHSIWPDAFTMGVQSGVSGGMVLFPGLNDFSIVSSPISVGSDSTSHRLFIEAATGNIAFKHNSPDASLTLDVHGNVGADLYCDRDGNNCTAPGSLSAPSVTGGNMPLNLQGANVSNTLP